MKRPYGIIPILIVLLTFPILSSANDTFRCIKVLDGDTIVLDNGDRVRLIGVDTTEKFHPLKSTEYFSEKATQFTKSLLESKEVRLEYDKERRGKYGRLLAYVHLLDGTFVNAEIIKQGYGFVYTKYPFKYKDVFVALEREAQRNKQGYWKFDGKGELRWIIERGQEPFLVYQMSRNLWGVKYNGFIKTRLNNDQIVSALKNLRRWIHEFHKDDLTKQLLSSGWERWDEK